MIYVKERLVTGRLEANAPKLIVRPDRIDESIREGEDYRGELYIGTDREVVLSGNVISDSARLIPDAEEISGTSFALPFTVATRGLKAGETFEGGITLVTDHGEVTVPVVISLEEKTPQVSDRSIRYLDEFVELARRSYAEAFRIFSDPDFASLLTGPDASCLMLYRGLSRNPVTYQRLEEFLIASGKKEAVTLTMPAGEVSFDRVTESRKEILTLTRSTWGYIHYEIETTGGFLETAVKKLTDEDFVGSRCQLEYILHAEKLTEGHHEGQIIISSARETLIYRVRASRGLLGAVSMHRVEKKNILRLNRLTFDMCLGRTSLETWKTRMQTLLTAIREMGDYPAAYVLLEAGVAYKAGETARAAGLVRSLQHHDFKQEAPEVKAAFLVLCHACQLLPPGSVDIKERLRDWRRRHLENFPILYMLMAEDEDLQRTPAKKLILMEDIYERGCESGFLFLEALNLMTIEPSELRKLTPFTRRVLLFGIRYGLLTGELSLKAAALSENEKTFDAHTFRILAGAYEAYPSKTLLEAICRLIMKGDPRDPAYFPYYAEAVEENVRLTRLYEYYIETIPDTYRDLLPLPVRKYFRMTSSVPARKLAFIYANIIRNRTQDEDTYADYREVMADFAARSLKNGLIDENYAVLYQEFYRMISDKEEAEALCRVMYTEKIVCGDPRIREVVVCHRDLKKEEVFSLSDGMAYVQIYTPKAGIFFQDARGRRFVTGISYSRKRLMETDALTDDCLALDVRHPGFLLHACKRDAKKRGITLKNISAFRSVAESEAFNEDYRRKIRLHILAFFTANAGNDTLDRYLSGIDYDSYIKADRVLLIEILILRSFYHEAYDMILRSGAEHINIGLLVRLVSAMIEEEGRENKDLVDLAYYVYRHKKYDERTILYLVRYFDGQLSAMLEIRKSAVSFDIDTYELDERILVRSAYVRQRIRGDAILRHYRKEGGGRSVVLAYLTFAASSYLLGGEKLSPYEADLISEAYDKNKVLDDACLLARLKYDSSLRTLDDKEEARAEKLLAEMTEKGIRLPFFADLPIHAIFGSGLRDRVFVEAEASPGDRVTLRYRLSNGPSGGSLDMSEPMPNVFRGIYVREFVLFYGETLTYRIETGHDGRVEKGPERVLTLSSPEMTGVSRYQLINQMLSASKLKKEALFAEKDAQYRKSLYLSQKLFAIDDRDPDQEVTKDE